VASGYRGPVDLDARSAARRWLAALAGVAVGTSTALLTPLMLVPGMTARLTRIELRRINRFLGGVDVGGLTQQRCRRYLALRWLVGGLGFGVLLVLTTCAVVAGSMLTAWIFSGSWGLIEEDQRVSTGLVLLAVPPGVLLVFLGLVGVTGVGTLDRWLATEVLGSGERLRLRVQEVVEAITDERRRIERDLHDGVQQHLVALGMLIGRARRGDANPLLEQAHAAAQEAIRELRGVALRIYPSALDSDGLHTVLESLAERATVPIRLTFTAATLPSAVETAVYFVVSEAVTNASKHACPTDVEVAVTQAGDQVHVVVTDNGRGGADPTGTGLSGLARRVAAVDGSFAVTSPVGGPTVVEAWLPCA
jgi:signal transduction histidine kinase